MNKATGLAMAPAQMVRALGTAVLMSVVLAACGGGAPTRRQFGANGVDLAGSWWPRAAR